MFCAQHLLVLTMFSPLFDNLLEVIRSPYAINLAAGLAVIWALRMAYLTNRKGPRTTRLRGPPSGFFGAEEVLIESPDPAAVHEAWYKEYGAAYEIPLVLGERKIILCDPKALAHFFAKDSWTYVLARADKVALARSVRGSLIYCISLSSVSRSERVFCWLTARFTEGMGSTNIFIFQCQ